MASSLILLSLFLAIWLKELYIQEINRLKEKSSFVFINSIRAAETDYIKKELLAPILALKKNKGDSVSITEININVSADSEQREVTYGVTDSIWTNLETKMQIIVQQGEEDPIEEGAMMTWLWEKQDTSNYDSLLINFKDSLLTTSIKKMLENVPMIKELPESFHVINVKDSTSQLSKILSTPYRDVESGEQFALAFEDYTRYILKKIWPQIFFSILLFATTLLAFFFVYKNLRDQQRLTALKNDLISNITHELKTPIATVGVAIEALQKFGALDDPKRTEEYLNISQQELNRLSILVDKVLTTSLFEKTDFQLKTESINFKELVERVLNTMKLQFQKKEAEVVFDSRGTDFYFTGDRIHLTSVIYNLLDNALKYSSSLPKINIELVGKKDKLLFTIQDNGVGIAKEYQSKIFNKFFRIPSGNTHNVKGHGLGLSYVKQVVEKHNGEISLESGLGDGTRFQIQFPVL